MKLCEHIQMVSLASVQVGGLERNPLFPQKLQWCYMCTTPPEVAQSKVLPQCPLASGSLGTSNFMVGRVGFLCGKFGMAEESITYWLVV